MKKRISPALCWAALLALAVATALLAACTQNAAPGTGQSTSPNPVASASQEANNNSPSLSGSSEKEEDPMVEITMKDGGVIRVELNSEAAPITVENFTTLVNQGFYDGLIFHRIIPGFMIQGGDPTGSGMGGPGHNIQGEFSSNGWENPISHERGVISMARSGNPNSAGSQFFIMHADYTSLDGDYAAFGQVVEGMDVVDRIANTETGAGDRPVDEEAATIETIRIVE